MKKRYLIAGAGAAAGTALAAKLLSRPRDVEWEKYAGELQHAEHSRFAEVEGVRVHYQEAGPESAPPVILIHGFSASTAVWSSVLLPIAAAGLRVIAPDLAGHGFSEKPRAGEYTIEAQARLIVGLMDELKLESATLVGSSYGGAVAATCALDYAERVERLVLVSAVTNDEAKKQFLVRLGAAPVVGDLVSPLLLGSKWLVRRRAKRFYAENRLPYDERRLEARHRILRASDTQRAILMTLRRWRADRIEREAHLIRQPTLLIWGENDPDIPLRHARRLHQAIPDARLIIFRRCGHLPQEEYPREFTELVTEFCDGTRAIEERQGAEPLVIDEDVRAPAAHEAESVLEI